MSYQIIVKAQNSLNWKKKIKMSTKTQNYQKFWVVSILQVQTIAEKENMSVKTFSVSFGKFIHSSKVLGKYLGGKSWGAIVAGHSLTDSSNYYIPYRLPSVYNSYLTQIPLEGKRYVMFLPTELKERKSS